MRAGTEGRDVRAVLRGLAEAEGVRGALLVAPDGLVIASALPAEIGVEALSALTATLGREVELRAGLPRHGAFVAARFAAETGTMVLGATAIGFLVVFADGPPHATRLTDDVRTAAAILERAWRGPASA